MPSGSDSKPVAEFRDQAASLIRQIRETKRALVLTERGRSAAVVVDAGEYQRMLDELELLRDIHTAEEQLAAGEEIGHAEARRRGRARWPLAGLSCQYATEH